MRYFYIILLFLVFAACNQKQQNNNLKNASFDKNDSILITYYRGLITTRVAIHCEKLSTKQEQHLKNRGFYIISDESENTHFKNSSVLDGKNLVYIPPEIIDTFIVDNTMINKIIKLLDSSVKADDFNEDARMYVTIKRNEGQQDHLCFDDFPYRVKYNGQSCSIDKEALFLLRYYSGYYSWFNERNLGRFEELKDTVYYQSNGTGKIV